MFPNCSNLLWLGHYTGQHPEGITPLHLWQACARSQLQVRAGQEQGAPTTTKKRTTGPPILPPINDNVRPLLSCMRHCVCTFWGLVMWPVSDRCYMSSIEACILLGS